MEDAPKFNVIVLGIIFDPAKKKILIGRRENDPEIPELTWCFPGGELLPGEEIDATLKKQVELKTGYKIKNLGAFFSKTYEEKENLLAVYFLTEVFEGEEKPGDKIVELKWVSPEELEKYFTTSFHRKLKKFLLYLTSNGCDVE
jgi:ADP-ribose pyrophosphatase YjhB (NUDIX family)